MAAIAHAYAAGTACAVALTDMLSTLLRARQYDEASDAFADCLRAVHPVPNLLWEWFVDNVGFMHREAVAAVFRMACSRVHRRGAARRAIEAALDGLARSSDAVHCALDFQRRAGKLAWHVALLDKAYDLARDGFHYETGVLVRLGFCCSPALSSTEEPVL